MFRRPTLALLALCGALGPGESRAGTTAPRSFQLVSSQGNKDPLRKGAKLTLYEGHTPIADWSADAGAKVDLRFKLRNPQSPYRHIIYQASHFKRKPSQMIKQAPKRLVLRFYYQDPNRRPETHVCGTEADSVELSLVPNENGEAEVFRIDDRGKKRIVSVTKDGHGRIAKVRGTSGDANTSQFVRRDAVFLSNGPFGTVTLTDEVDPLFFALPSQVNRIEVIFVPSRKKTESIEPRVFTLFTADNKKFGTHVWGRKGKNLDRWLSQKMVETAESFLVDTWRRLASHEAFAFLFDEFGGTIAPELLQVTPSPTASEIVRAENTLP